MTPRKFPSPFGTVRSDLAQQKKSAFGNGGAEFANKLKKTSAFVTGGAEFEKQCKTRRLIHVKSSAFGNEKQSLHFLRTEMSDTVGRSRSVGRGRGRGKT